MQCAQCGSPIEVKSSGQAAAACPKCGAPVSAGAPARRSGGSWTAVVVLLLVGLAAISAGAIMFAMQAVEERDRAIADYARSAGALDEIIAATAGSGRLKGPPAATARQEIFAPAIKYYQDFAAKYDKDEKMLPEVASAKLHLASLQAKTGSPECAKTLTSGVGALSAMVKADFPEETYPGFQAIVLRIAEPTDWVMVKTDDRAGHGIRLFLAIDQATSAYQQLVTKYPKSVGFRDDLTALLASAATLLQLMPGKSGSAMYKWTDARDVLETLVKDDPSNTEFQTRLADSLENAAKIQLKIDGEKDNAIGNYKRAVEVRQQLAEAKPDDKTLKQQLANAESALAAAAPADAAKESPEGEPKPEEAPKAEAPKEEVPAPEAGPPEAAAGTEAPAAP